MASSIWPFDYYKQLHDIYRSDPFELVVFLASPFAPEERYQDLHEFCQLVCTDLGRQFGIPIRCQRSDTPSTPDVIHHDIWNYIQRSDALIIDISDQNPNVMIELGVASANRDKNQVILIKDSESKKKQIFDISPARYLVYNRNRLFDREFFSQLMNALSFSLTPAPYIPKETVDFQLPLDINNQNPDSYKKLLSPPSLDRRYTYEGLEFGSLFLFQYSWLTLGKEDFSDIRLITKMKFNEINPRLSPGEGWIGISLRSQHFYANFGHLFYIKSDGTIIYARPSNDIGRYEDLELGKLENFNMSEWITFDITFDENILKIRINDFNKEFDIKDKNDMPFCYGSGMIRFQTFKSRACIQSIFAEIPKETDTKKLPKE